MNTYCLLLRGINLGKQNKVSMPELRQQLEELGLEHIKSYINTGNLFFRSNLWQEELVAQIADLLGRYYDFSIPFTLLPALAILRDVAQLPAWWQDDTAYRRDALFYLPPVTKETVAELLDTWPVTEGEVYHMGETALFWLTPRKDGYNKTAHAKKIMAKPFNQMVTLRNANTTMKLVDLIEERGD